MFFYEKNPTKLIMVVSKHVVVKGPHKFVWTNWSNGCELFLWRFFWVPFLGYVSQMYMHGIIVHKKKVVEYLHGQLI
jgi:hypothetical protein